MTNRRPDDGPTHPKLAAALMMVAIIVFLVVVALVGAVGASTAGPGWQVLSPVVRP